MIIERQKTVMDNEQCSIAIKYSYTQEAAANKTKIWLGPILITEKKVS